MIDRSVPRHWLLAYWQQRTKEIDSVFGEKTLRVPYVLPDSLYRSPLAKRLEVARRLINGYLLDQQACQGRAAEYLCAVANELCARMGKVPQGYQEPRPPEEAWGTPGGRFVLLAWEAAGELLTITAAAEFLNVSSQAISDRLKRGTLDAYPAPEETFTDRRAARRVRRSQL